MTRKRNGAKVVCYVIIMYFYISIFVGRAERDVSSDLRCLFILFWGENVSFLKFTSTEPVVFHYFVMFAINIL